MWSTVASNFLLIFIPINNRFTIYSDHNFEEIEYLSNTKEKLTLSHPVLFISVRNKNRDAALLPGHEIVRC
jgi:hypothetical protein